MVASPGDTARAPRAHASRGGAQRQRRRLPGA